MLTAPGPLAVPPVTRLRPGVPRYRAGLQKLERAWSCEDDHLTHQHSSGSNDQRRVPGNPTDSLHRGSCVLHPMRSLRRRLASQPWFQAVTELKPEPEFGEAPLAGPMGTRTGVPRIQRDRGVLDWAAGAESVGSESVSPAAANRTARYRLPFDSLRIRAIQAVEIGLQLRVHHEGFFGNTELAGDEECWTELPRREKVRGIGADLKWSVLGVVNGGRALNAAGSRGESAGPAARGVSRGRGRGCGRGGRRPKQ